MRKIIQFLYIVSFFGICIVPSIFFFLGDTNNNKAENRSQTKLPSIIKEDKLNLQYPSEMETYFSENFGFRTKMVNANAEINYNLLGQSSSSKVIVGKDGFLYFNDTLDDFTGRNTLSKTSIGQIVKTLELMKEYIESKGSIFYFTIAPNKNSIYPEYMPNRYSKGEINNYWLLRDSLKYSDLKFIDLKAFLLDEKAKDENYFYFKTDSHWNNYGGEKAYRYILSKINANTNLEDKSIYLKENSWIGDLYKMLFPEGTYKDEDFVYDTKKNYTSQKPYNVEDINISTKLKKEEADINSGKKLLIFRDSFFNSLIKFVSNDFLEVKYSRQVPYPLNEINDEIVLLEIVERNIPLLVKSAPIMAAPSRDKVDLSKYEKINRENIFFYKDEENEYTHLYGYYKPEKPMETSEVLLKYDDMIFEAFPILEDKIKDDIVEKYGDSITKQGFSLRIPKDSNVQIDDFDIYIKK